MSFDLLTAVILRDFFLYAFQISGRTIKELIVESELVQEDIGCRFCGENVSLIFNVTLEACYRCSKCFS